MSNKPSTKEFASLADIISLQVTAALKRLNDPKTQLDIETLIQLKAAQAAFDAFVNNWSSVYNNFIRRGIKDI